MKKFLTNDTVKSKNAIYEYIVLIIHILSWNFDANFIVSEALRGIKVENEHHSTAFEYDNFIAFMFPTGVTLQKKALI